MLELRKKYVYLPLRETSSSNRENKEVWSTTVAWHEYLQYVPPVLGLVLSHTAFSSSYSSFSWLQYLSLSTWMWMWMWNISLQFSNSNSKKAYSISSMTRGTKCFQCQLCWSFMSICKECLILWTRAQPTPAATRDCNCWRKRFNGFLGCIFFFHCTVVTIAALKLSKLFPKSVWALPRVEFGTRRARNQGLCQYRYYQYRYYQYCFLGIGFIWFPRMLTFGWSWLR